MVCDDAKMGEKWQSGGAFYKTDCVVKLFSPLMTCNLQSMEEILRLSS